MSPRAYERLKFIAEAHNQLHKPYIYGANGPDTFDCSGLVLHCYRAAGAKIGDMRCWEISALCRSEGQFATLAGKDLDLIHVRPGTLFFYGPSATGASHVMIAFGDGRVIGASGGGADTTTPTPGKCVKFKPAPNYRPDLVAVGELPFLLKE